MQREPFRAAVIFGQRRARLHRGDDGAAVDQVELHRVRGRGESLGHGVGVAIMEVECDIAGDVVVDRRCRWLGRLAQRRHDRQRLDVGDDCLGGIARLLKRLRHDAGDRIADEAHLVAGKGRPRRLLHLGAVTALERQAGRHAAVARQVGGGIDREHARHGARGLGVDPADHAMADLAADDHRMGLVRQADVVGVAALAPQEPGVLGAQHRLADSEEVGLVWTFMAIPAVLAISTPYRSVPTFTSARPDCGHAVRAGFGCMSDARLLHLNTTGQSPPRR